MENKTERQNIFAQISEALTNPDTLTSDKIKIVSGLLLADAVVQLGLPQLSRILQGPPQPYADYATDLAVTGAISVPLINIVYKHLTNSFDSDPYFRRLHVRETLLAFAFYGAIGHAGGQALYHLGAPILKAVEDQVLSSDHKAALTPANNQTPPPIILNAHPT